MIELNLLEKKKPLVLPTVLGMDLNNINFKLVGIAIVLFYSTDFGVNQIFGDKILEAEETLTQVRSQNTKLSSAIQKDANIKALVDAYKLQVSKLQSRSNQVDEILKNRTNPRKILEKIARSIPEDLWFDVMTINEKNEITITGGSYSPRAIGEFITTINDSPYFSGSITPAKQENKKENLDGIPTSFEKFELRGKITNYDMRTK